VHHLPSKWGAHSCYGGSNNALKLTHILSLQNP